MEDDDVGDRRQNACINAIVKDNGIAVARLHHAQWKKGKGTLHHHTKQIGATNMCPRCRMVCVSHCQGLSVVLSCSPY